MQKDEYLKLAFYLAVPLLVGFLGAFFTASSVAEWYAFLEKPFFAPPNWVFGPVWTALYLLMGAAAYLASKKKADMRFYWIQLGLNGLWSPLFFGLKSPLLGLIGIALLLVFILATMRAFYKADKRAAYLLVPYLLWVALASLLNLSIFLMNP